MINCYSLIIASSIVGRVCISDVAQLYHTINVSEASYFGLEFQSYFSSSWIISRVQDGIHLSRWIYRSLIFFWSSFLCHCISDPRRFRFMFIGVNIELSPLVLWNKSHPHFVVGGCTCLSYRSNAPIVWLEPFHRTCITTNSYASCKCLANTTFIHISRKLSRCLPSLPWHHWDCGLIQYVSKEVSF